MKYTYLALCAFLFAAVGVCLIVRRDLVKPALRAGLAGGVPGIVAEFFYFRDYWRPPSLAGVARVSPEDFLAGFGVMALSVVLYAAVARKALVDAEMPPRGKLSGGLVLGGFVCMVVLNLFLGINSIIASYVVFVATAAVICWLRRDLMKPAIYSAVLLTVVMSAVYIVLFDWLFPGFWDTYWLLAHGSLGKTILGNIPVTELVWYFLWGLLGGIGYLFVTGQRLEDKR